MVQWVLMVIMHIRKLHKIEILKTKKSWGIQDGSESQLCHVLAVWLWGNSSSLSLWSLFIKIDNNTHVASESSTWEGEAAQGTKDSVPSCPWVATHTSITCQLLPITQKSWIQVRIKMKGGGFGYSVSDAVWSKHFAKVNKKELGIFLWGGLLIASIHVSLLGGCKDQLK